MQRLRRFLHATVTPARLADRRMPLGWRDRWVPETIEDFDEIEFAIQLDDEKDAVMTIALEDGKIARLLLGLAAAGDDEADTMGFVEDELPPFLERHGEDLVRFLDSLTGGGAT